MPIVYHIQNGIANTMWYLRQSTDRKHFYGERRLEIGAILRQLCQWKGVNTLEAEVCIDHVHMLLEIPPKMAVSSFMGYLKGKRRAVRFLRILDVCSDIFTT